MDTTTNDHHWDSPRYSSVQWYRQQYCTSTPAIHTIRAKDSPWESETRKLYSYYSVVSKAQPPSQSVSGLLTYTLTGEGHTELYVDEWSIGAVDFYANTKYTQKVNIGHPQTRILYECVFCEMNTTRGVEWLTNRLLNSPLKIYSNSSHRPSSLIISGGNRNIVSGRWGMMW